MLITRRSMVTGKVHTRELDVTEEQIRAWIAGTLIQRAMPQLSPPDREFVKTGITPEEWIDTFRGFDDDDDNQGENA